jgi:RNA polymerase sigma-70 factor (family 1)
MTDKNYSNFFDQAFRDYYRSLVQFACKLIYHKEAAEDIVMKVYSSLWEKKEDIRVERATKTLLYVCTRNACVNFNLFVSCRKMHDRKIWYLATDATEDFVLDKIIDAEALNGMLNEFETLPVKCRRIMYLSFKDGFDNKEIAAELDLSVSTVKSQRTRGIKILRKRLEDE